ncbi:MAG: Re/Si-specific NAD(P)(+) transhydrogenase subunit alpha [Thermoguttaceae bacterium]|jgi:NAD(P) transhydrogenase subunit alpha
MIVGVPQETFPGERRVALVPATVATLIKAGFEVRMQSGAGLAAGYPDQQYLDKGAKLTTREEALAADVLLLVRVGGANPEAGRADLPRLRAAQVIVGLCDPFTGPQAIAELAQRGVTLFSLELLPRITRAQSMDVLSSQATLAGYRAVLLAAVALPKMFPMMMTAAGTITPARVFVIGAGVAGLQAIATSARLGGIVSAYDVRPAVKEQVQSLGAKFVEVPLDTSAAETKGGYAQQMDEAFLQRQRDLMARVVAESDVVITTAAVPGKKAPLLVTTAMVEGMAAGAVLVDLAAERGGNCELTRPGERLVHKGVVILGPTNLPAEVPFHASQLYAKNITTFLLALVKDGQIKLDMDDEIIRETLVTRDGKVVNAAVAAKLTEN